MLGITRLGTNQAGVIRPERDTEMLELCSPAHPRVCIDGFRICCAGFAQLLPVGDSTPGE